LPREGQFIVDANMNIVAEIPCQGANPADGKLIVTAVNERDALLAEVRAATERFESEHELLTKVVGERNELREEAGRLREALELLQGFDFRLDDSPHGKEIRRRTEAALSGKKEGE